MRKDFTAWAVLVGVLAGSAAMAQPSPPSDVALPARVETNPQPAEEATLPAPIASVRRFQVLPSMAPRVELTHERTLFHRDTHVTFFRLWDGRLHVGCFHNVRPASPFSEPPVGRAVPGALQPLEDWSEGIRVSIHFGRR